MSDADNFLEALTRLGRQDPGLEASVFWLGPDGWAAQDDDLLEAEEMAFYAEGLLMEGFGMVWQSLAAQPDAARPDHVRMFFWQGVMAPLPAPPSGWHVLNSETRQPA